MIYAKPQEVVDVYDSTISFWRKNVALFSRGETCTIWGTFFNLFGDEYTKFSLVYNGTILEEENCFYKTSDPTSNFNLLGKQTTDGTTGVLLESLAVQCQPLPKINIVHKSNNMC